MSPFGHRFGVSTRTKEILVGASMSALLLFGVVSLTPSVWVPAWQPGGLGHTIVEGIISTIGIGTHAALYLFVLGLFLGSASLWLFDTLKRYQGLCLWIAIGAGLVLFISNWEVRIPETLALHILIFAFGGICGLQLGGVPIVSYVTNRYKVLTAKPPYFFKGAIKATSFIILSLIVIGLVDFHYLSIGRTVPTAQDSGVLLEHIIASGAILVPLGTFARYQSGTHIIQLGPARSGKTSIVGGLYADSGYKLEDGDESLEIYKEAIAEGEFPDRTEVGDNPDSWDVIRFSYITDGFLLRRKQEVTTVDYSGELLTGLEGEHDGTEPISKYVKQLRNKESRSDKWRNGTRWERAIEALQEETTSREEFIEQLATLVITADTLVFTLPTEDFLHDLIEKRPENIPEYLADDLYHITLGQAEDEKDTLERTNVGTGNTVSLQKQSHNTPDGSLSVKYLPPRGEEVGLPPEPSGWLETSNGYYALAERDREPPEAYVQEYQNIVNALSDVREYRFVWMMSMADLALQDFKSGLQSLTGPSPDGGTTGSSSHESEVTTNQQFIDSGTLSSPFVKGTESPATNELSYRVFSYWLVEDYLKAANLNLADLMDQTFEHYVYPVWFNIKDETGQKFVADTGYTLKGSKFLMRRYNGQRLKFEHTNTNAIIYDVFDLIREKDEPSEPKSKQLYNLAKDHAEVKENNRS